MKYKRLFLAEVKPGDEVYGMVLWHHNETIDRPYTWGTPWKVKSIEFSHDVPEHTYQGYVVPLHKMYYVEIESASPINWQKTLCADYEGFLVVEDNEP